MAFRMDWSSSKWSSTAKIACLTRSTLSPKFRSVPYKLPLKLGSITCRPHDLTSNTTKKRNGCLTNFSNREHWAPKVQDNWQAGPMVNVLNEQHKPTSQCKTAGQINSKKSSCMRLTRTLKDQFNWSHWSGLKRLNGCNILYLSWARSSRRPSDRQRNALWDNWSTRSKVKDIGQICRSKIWLRQNTVIKAATKQTEKDRKGQHAPNEENTSNDRLKVKALQCRPKTYIKLWLIIE